MFILLFRLYHVLYIFATFSPQELLIDSLSPPVPTIPGNFLSAAMAIRCVFGSCVGKADN